MNSPWTIGAVLDWTVGYFERSNIPDARLEAELLLSTVLDCPRLKLVLKREEVLPETELKEFHSIIEERKKRKPISYIIGEQEFMGLKFKVSKHTLIPRPETELLCEKVISLVNKGNNGVVVDLGSGSGCIAISVAKLSNVKIVVSVDISIEALRIVLENSLKHGCSGLVQPRHGDLFVALNGLCLEGMVDIIVTNPPYIPTDEIAGLSPELAWEPIGALDGGPDGLIFYRRICESACKYLKKNGYLLMELNAIKSNEIQKIVKNSGLKVLEIIKDYAGLDRILVAGEKNG